MSFQNETIPCLFCVCVRLCVYVPVHVSCLYDLRLPVCVCVCVCLCACVSHTQVLEDDSPDQLVRGTRVTLHLKEDAAELADPVRLSRLIKQYSQFISFPIKLYSMKKEPVKVRTTVLYVAHR